VGFIRDVDYTISIDPEINGSEVILTIEEPGLAKLNVARHPATVGGTVPEMQFILVFDVQAITQGHHIGNSATVTINEGEPVESNTVEVSYGGKTLWKYDANCLLGGGVNEAYIEGLSGMPSDLLVSGESTCDFPVAGAMFFLFGSLSDANAFSQWVGNGANMSDMSSLAGIIPIVFYDLTGTETDPNDSQSYQIGLTESCYVPDPTNVFSLTWPPGTACTAVYSQADGQANFAGLAYGTYWAVEAAVPAPYQRSARPIRVDITEPLDTDFFADGVCVGYGSSEAPLTKAECVADSGTWNASRLDDLLIPNAPKNAGFPFPITGGSSSLIYLLMGGVVLGGTLYLIRKQSAPTPSVEPVETTEAPEQAARRLSVG